MKSSTSTKSSALEKFITYLEKKPVWIIGLFLLCLSFLPCLLLGKGVLFDCYDTYDGALLTYMLKAKYLFTGVETYPELMNGIPVSGMTVPAPFFVILYYFFSPFVAHTLQYVILSLTAYAGMYLCANRITNFKCVSTLIALLFALLPFQPVYGHSVVGLPLAIYAFLCLYEKKRVVLAYVCIAYFVLTSSLVYIGYACIIVLAVAGVILLIRKKLNKEFVIGCLLLGLLYCLTNLDLIYDTFISSGFVSHREEFILYNTDFWATFKSVFLASAELAVSCHMYMILPILVLHLIQSIRYKKLTQREKSLYKLIWFSLVAIIGLCAIYALNFWEPVVKIREQLPSAIKHFQFQRICFFLPVLWYIVAATSLTEIWEMRISLKKLQKAIPYVKVVVMIAFMAMTIITIRRESFYRWNLNQLQSPNVDFGISYEEFYSEEQFAEIKEYIGRPQDTYKVASLGLCPAVPLYNGFYCIDGYSNNYPLSYKHEFRQILEKEMEKEPGIAYYYDTWGSRCYLFASETGCGYSLPKGTDFVYEDLDFNTEVMKEMGCEYIFSAAPIANPEKMNLVFIEEFPHDVANQNIYLYGLQ